MATRPAEQNTAAVDIELLLETLNKVRSEAKNDKEFGFNKPFGTFLTLMSFLNPQSYGLRIQNRLELDLKWKRAKVADDKGDLVDLNNQHYEIKASLITETNSALNLVQLRLWQNVNYVCLWFDVRSKKYSTYVLTHEQMVEEAGLMSSSAHGTKSANLENKRKELRISLTVNPENEDFKRWEKNYKSDLLDFLFKS